MYVYSTLANDNVYTGYTEGGADLPRKTYEILVKGGTGVAGKWTNLMTPRGVVTEITDEEAEALKSNVIFNRHKDNGFVTLDSKYTEPEKVAADMEGRDASAPLVDEDFGKKDERNPGAPTQRKHNR